MTTKHHRRPLTLAATLALAALVAGIQPAAANAITDLAVGNHGCDAGSGFGNEAGNCPIGCEPGSEMQATMTTKNGDPNRWVHAAIDCGGIGTARTCPNAASCTTSKVTAVSWAKGMCHGAVANENGDWYRWALYCAVGNGEQLNVPLDDLLDDLPPLGGGGSPPGDGDDPPGGGGIDCNNVKSRHMHVQDGSYRIISGAGTDVSAVAFGKGECIPIEVKVDHIDNLVFVSA